jgi:predicted ATPase/class 3 adenylate cyclase
VASAQVPAGTVTFLFTDLEGSTRLWQERPNAMHDALARHDELLRHAIETHAGFVVKTMGDGFHAAFAAAHQALEAAVAAQRAIEAEPWTETGPLHVRMGVHSGPVEVRDGDYYGTTVNRAARLMGVAHGGQLVCSQATAELVRDDLADDVELVELGEHRLRDLARPVAIHQVVAMGLRREFPPLRSLDNAPTNLPVQPTSLVGRQALIAELASLLEHEPIVTLTGVGGVGKTRLAVEVGAEVLPRYPDGVGVVELAPLAHDEMVLQTIADVLGVAAQTSEPLVTTLLGRLRSKRLLIVIDNCEHVLDPVARFVDRLTSTASDVRVLATSREPLGVSAERVRAVPPLVNGTEATELFFERAQHAGAVIEGPEQVAAVGEICARLDGIPLAIELAAARARMMAPTQIAERLGQRFRLLTGGGRTAVERHRTLQATVSWSYELLDDTERLVFERLSTFAGSFALDAAEMVAAGGEIEEFEVLDALGHLVDKSMVLAEVGPGGLRYRLLETLRQFAADRLAASADAVDVQDRHASYFRGRALRLGRSAGETGHAHVFDDRSRQLPDSIRPSAVDRADP